MLHKKRTSLFAALLLLAMLCLAGCGSADNQAYVGKWNMTGGKANGVTVTQEEIQQMMPSMNLSVEFKADNTCEMVVMGQAYSGTYEVTEEGVIIRDDVSEQALTRQGDQLVLPQGTVEIYLTKEG